MYNNYIKVLQPKPIFNLKWYKDKDLYTEGDVEDLVVKLIAENEPEDYSDAICQNYNWSTYYHLTHIRKNILNWYPFNPEGEVLEIGCGMGAVTGVLCDKCKSVTAVELSKRRASAALLRCREKENLEIIVGNLNDIQFEKKFDYITLIGVFEYQGSYTNTDNPYKDFLNKIKSLLKPEGKLLIAIENQYGLKYWCGAREDHTGIPFDGMNQYEFSDKKVKTFSKQALEELVKECGLSNTFFYYPMPDYKLPTVVYSQEVLPENENMLNMNCYYIPDNSTLIIQEDKLYKDIIKNHVFEFFANSFLLECSEKGNVGEVTFASLSNRRQPEYQIGTRFTADKEVEKFAVDYDIAKGHIRQILENEKNLLNRGMKVWQSTFRQNMLVTKFCQAPTCEEMVLLACERKDKDFICSMFEGLYEEILRSSEYVDWQDNILYSFYPDMVREEGKYGIILKTGFLDMILRNAFWIENEFHWFDQEWVLENVPAIYIMYRALTELYSSFPAVGKVVPLVELAAKYNMVAAWNDMQQLEELFAGSVIDTKHFAASRGLSGVSQEMCVKNINKIL